MSLFRLCRILQTSIMVYSIVEKYFVCFEDRRKLWLNADTIGIQAQQVYPNALLAWLPPPNGEGYVYRISINVLRWLLVFKITPLELAESNIIIKNRVLIFEKVRWMVFPRRCESTSRSGMKELTCGTNSDEESFMMDTIQTSWAVGNCHFIFLSVYLCKSVMKLQCIGSSIHIAVNSYSSFQTLCEMACMFGWVVFYGFGCQWFLYAQACNLHGIFRVNYGL